MRRRWMLLTFHFRTLLLLPEKIMTAPTTNKGVAAPSLNVYKKVSVIRKPSDSLTYDDHDGNRKSVSIEELGDAIATATPLVLPRAKLDIPVPKINVVDSYTKDVTPDYKIPRSYVRYHRPSIQEWNENIEYVADKEDEAWLAQNTKFGGAVAFMKPPPAGTQINPSSANNTSSDKNNSHEKRPELVPAVPASIAPVPVRKPQITLSMLECMLDLMEKATGFNAIITYHEAERLTLAKLPQLYHFFPIKSKQGTTSLKQVINDVYTYWWQKRSKLKRPLLRCYWPVTSSDDTNPHLVFRPREKEKYKLRKKRQNDMDAYRKMKQLRSDFDNLRAVLQLVCHREDVSRTHVRLLIDLFQQRLHEMVDTSGGSRRNSQVDHEDVKHAMEIPNLFDVVLGGRKAKRVRTSGDANGTTPAVMGGTTFDTSRNKAAGTTAEAVVGNVAGRNNGEPAPNYLQPLNSRETFSSSWSNAVPHVTSYVDAHAVPTFRFRHRSRVGRGGRICIDRMPCPPHPDVSPVTVFTAGVPMDQSVTPRRRLLDLLPRPLNHQALSRKIEQISALAIKEDWEAKTTRPVQGTNPEENDGDEAIVKMDDWLDTDDQVWGEERFAIGPI